MNWADRKPEPWRFRYCWKIADLEQILREDLALISEVLLTVAPNRMYRPTPEVFTFQTPGEKH